MLPDAWNKCENHRQLDIITVRQIFRKGLLLLAAASLLAACRKEEPTPAERTAEYYRKRPCVELVACAARIVGEYLQQLDEIPESAPAAQ